MKDTIPKYTTETREGVEIITAELDRPGYEVSGTVFVKKNLTPKKRKEVINWALSKIAEREREATEFSNRL